MSAVVAILDQNPIVGEPKQGPRRFWTTREIAILREHWSAGGIDICLPLLPGRSASGIYGQAQKLGLLSPETVRRGVPRHRHTTTEFIDAAIKRTYQSRPTQGDIRRLAATVIRPRSWVRKRAEQLGVCVPRFKEPNWTAPELELLERNGAKHPDTIRKILSRSGYKRTSVAIVNKLKRLGIDRTDPDLMSCRAVGVLLGVNEKSVRRLIKRDGLPAKRAGIARVQAQGGDEWRIKRKDLRRFIIDNPTAIDIRKVDAVWFIELLGGPAT